MMQPGDRIVASELSGDFVLPSDPCTPLVFIAGGIGITPFRSMIKYLCDSGERRSIVLIYSNYRRDEIVFGEILREARERIGLRVIYTLTDSARVPRDWCGRTGFVDAAMIREEVPDFRESTFLVSGSLRMIETIRRALREIGVSHSHMQTDFFPGYTS